MADVLQEVLDAVADLKTAVSEDTAEVQVAVDEIAKLAARLPGADPAEVTAIAADIKAAADGVRTGTKAIADAVAAVETPPPTV
jgi:hypothetical protein